jgi:hypothetical protein
VTLHDIECVTRKNVCKHLIANVAPEQFGIARNATTIKDATYCFHEEHKTEHELIEAGFDEEQVKALPTFVLTAWSTGIEAIARDTENESTFSGADGGANNANRIVKVTEHYVVMDYDGDGHASRYRVITGGDQGEILKRNGQLSIDDCEDNPFFSLTPIPQPHRFIGRSIADTVIEIQKIKTALIRGKLDNLYLHNNPRVEVAEAFASENTIDDLLVSRPGGLVRVKQPGGINWQVVPDVSGSIYPALEYWDTVREWRTGVTRAGQGIDAEALQNQTATAVTQTYNAAQAKMRLIARIFAETGIKDLFSLLHGTIRQYGDAESTVRLRNQWVKVNPRDWRERNDMTITVGLGDGSKSARMAGVMAIINYQAQALAAGKTNLVDDAKVFNSAKELCKLLDYRDPTQFINDPNQLNPDGSPAHPPPQAPPDPKVQIEMMKAQNDAQAAQQKAQLEQQKAQTDAQHQVIKAQADIAVQKQKAQIEVDKALMDARLKHEQAGRDAQMQAQELSHKQQMHEMELSHKHAEHQMKLQQTGVEHSSKMEQLSAQTQAAKSKADGLKAKHPELATTDHVAKVHDAVNDHVAKLHEAVAAMHEAIGAPSEIVRDHAGKAIGVKKGAKVLSVRRGKDGRPQGLE